MTEKSNRNYQLDVLKLFLSIHIPEFLWEKIQKSFYLIAWGG